jgi:two-component system, sensor histidine kinase RegB
MPPMPLLAFNSDSLDHPANLRRLIGARWFFIALALGFCLSVPAWLGIALPLSMLLGVLALMATVNAISQWHLRRQPAVDANDIFSHLAFDTIGLATIVFFSGGVTNPMISLLLPPVAIAALTLPPRHVAGITGLAVAAYSALLVFYLPLAIDDPARATRLHLLGMWLTFVISTLLIAWFIVRMTSLIRQRNAELAQAREQALRDERVLALGTLAAGAAHELGTPLGTMALIAGELAHDPDLPAALQPEIKLLREQIATCKTIITGLSQRAGAERLEKMAWQPVDRWLHDLLARWHATKALPTSAVQLAGDAPAPSIHRRPEAAASRPESAQQCRGSKA